MAIAIDVLPTPGGPENRNEQAKGLAANFARTRLALDSPTNSASLRGRYFSLNRTGKAKVGVVIGHPPLTVRSGKYGTRSSSMAGGSSCARPCADQFPC